VWNVNDVKWLRFLVLIRWTVPITVVRTFIQSDSQHVSCVPTYSSPSSMLFKGCLNRKFLYRAISRDSLTDTRHTRDRREKERKINASKRAKAWKKLDRPRFRASPSFRGSSRRFRRSFLSCFRSHARFLHPFFPPPFRTAIFLSSCDRLHSACRIKGEERARMRKDIASAGSVMKRTSRPALYRY